MPKMVQNIPKNDLKDVKMSPQQPGNKIILQIQKGLKTLKIDQIQINHPQKSGDKNAAWCSRIYIGIL